MTTPFALIGPGRVGCAVSKRLLLADFPLQAVVGTSLAAARDACEFIGCDIVKATTDIDMAAPAPLILVAVPDDAIISVAHQLQSQNCLNPATVLLHFSGVHPADIMRHPDSPVALGCLHPLLPFADRQMATEQLPSAAFTLEGDLPARERAAAIIQLFGAKAFTIKAEHKHLYHAAACIASNYLITLIDQASRMLAVCGINPEETIELLSPLLTATLRNLQTQGSHQGLTGPIVRGDIGTIKLHLEALQQAIPSIGEENLSLYCVLGLQTVNLAETSGRLDSTKATEISALLHQALKACRQ